MIWHWFCPVKKISPILFFYDCIQGGKDYPSMISQLYALNFSVCFFFKYVCLFFSLSMSVCFFLFLFFSFFSFFLFFFFSFFLLQDTPSDVLLLWIELNLEECPILLLFLYEPFQNLTFTNLIVQTNPKSNLVQIKSNKVFLPRISYFCQETISLFTVLKI